LSRGRRYAGTPGLLLVLPGLHRGHQPNHVSGRFSTSCDSCHSTNAWRPRRRPQQDGLPAHGGASGRELRGLPHKGGTRNVQGLLLLPRRRLQRHGQPQPRPRRVSEVLPGFTRRAAGNGDPTTTARSSPSTRKHKGKWGSCNDCHKSAGNYKAFECILCHEHSNKAEVDSKHKGESGYVYSSAACYRCHPQGRAE
jgi:hypothetical protein